MGSAASDLPRVVSMEKGTDVDAFALGVSQGALCCVLVRPSEAGCNVGVQASGADIWEENTQSASSFL